MNKRRPEKGSEQPQLSSEQRGPERNVQDVDYVGTADTRPMREVLAERKRRARGLDKKTLVQAHRERASTIGELQSCLCAYPIEKSDTASEHAEWCPAHHLFLARKP